MQRPFGEITRGTTNPNRLRRADRWLLATQAARLRGTAARPALVVDLGYGASPVTTIELAERLAAHARTRRSASSGGIEVIGLEIDPERVRRARLAAERRQAVVGDSSAVPVTFGLGGFETPTPNGRPATVIRAFNVLRQYDESEVPASWEAMQARLTGTGIIIDGTCNELGRRMTWVTLDADGPKSLTVSVAFGAIEAPSASIRRGDGCAVMANAPVTRKNRACDSPIRSADRSTRSASFPHC